MARSFLSPAISFPPLHVEHVNEYLPEISEYLDLPPGYRFLIDGNNFEDVWFDSELLNALQNIKTRLAPHLIMHTPPFNHGGTYDTQKTLNIMSNLIALFFICAPTLFFGWCLVFKWGGALDSNSDHWRFYTVAPLMLMLLYFYVTLFFGAEAVTLFYSISGKSYDYTSNRHYPSVFIWPGLGFGIATFPKQAAELLGDYLTLAKAKTLNWFAIIGWLLIVAWLFKTVIAFAN